MFDELFQLWKCYWGKATDSGLMKRLFEDHVDGTKWLILPKNFPRSLSTPGYRILVRPEYGRLMDALKKRSAEHDWSFWGNHSLATTINGDPGIGRYPISSIY
jgi:hypothetical protein